MTEDNKRENVKLELEYAAKALKEAHVLFENELFNGAISRLYYSLLHDIGALLLSRGIEAKSHEGALRLLSLYFVKEGVFEPKAAHLLSKLMKYREEADYNPAYIFVGEDFTEFQKEVKALSSKIKSYLQTQGYI